MHATLLSAHHPSPLPGTKVEVCSKSHAQRQALASQLIPGETLAPLIAFPEFTKHPFTLPLITLWILALTHLFTSLRTLEPRGAVLFLDVRWQMQMVSLL